MKLLKTFLTGLLLLNGVCAFAATEKEMEQARTAAAKVYLRWANNMSGYLDETNPTTISELEASLREQEMKNLQPFVKAGMPSDYASWDKDKVVEYWSTTFFQNAKDLNPVGRTEGARNAMKRELKKVKVTANAAQAEPAPENNLTPAEPDNQQGAPEVPETNYEEIEEVAAVNPEVQSQEPAESPAPEEQPIPKPPKNGSSTWVYVLILIILVIAVILLVVYASRTMKSGGGLRPRAFQRGRRGDQAHEAHHRDGGYERPEIKSALPEKPSRYERQTPKAAEKESHASSGAGGADSSRMREKYASEMASKQDEIRILRRKVSDMEQTNEDLMSKISSLRRENDALLKELNAIREANASSAAASAASLREPRQNELRGQKPVEDSAPNPKSEVKEIYLGRVNSNGVFVRADRTFSPGNSVYKLVTTDGFSGTFKVVENHTLEMMALEHPEEFLAGGCVAKDLTDIVGRTTIVTETAGTAIFEGGAWRVIRKARIRYD